MSYRRIDITGQRFGRLVAIEFAGKNKAGNALWKFKCDCGNEPIIIASHVRLNPPYKPTKSCGCITKERMKTVRLGVRPPNALPIGDACLNDLFRAYEHEAERKKLSFELSKEQFRFFTKQNCFYCNKEPSTIRHRKSFGGIYVYNGIDRIDNSKGYTLDNCVSCCKICNQSKSSLTKEEFLIWIKSVYDFSIKDKEIF